MSLQPERIASATLHIGDCLDVLPQLAAEGFRAHAVVTDPPYHLIAGGLAINRMAHKVGQLNRRRNPGGFMNADWDGGDVAFRPETWAAVRECMLPGAHLVAFGGTRTFHRMVCAIEDAGFEIRDTLMWVYGSGYPKSLNVSKAIDRAAGAEREVVGSKLGQPGYSLASSKGVNLYGGAFGGTGDPVMEAAITAPATPEAAAWAGWGTALKPAVEMICLARKPLSEGTVAANVLRHGTGAINVDACRVGTTENTGRPGTISKGGILNVQPGGCVRQSETHAAGRWPANLLHDGSPEVEQAFAAFGTSQSTDRPRHNTTALGRMNDDAWQPRATTTGGFADAGSPSRFFYTAKADARDRAGSRHPTVKPASLMRWLVRLVCPEGGTILDPFAGSGSTGLAADQCGMRSVLIERDPTYAGDALRKIREDAPLFAEASPEPQPDAAYQRHGDLFADAAD